MKLKKFRLHWSVEVTYYKEVKAFDAQDAIEQFDSIIHSDGMPKGPWYAQLDEVEEMQPVRKKKVKK